MSKPIEYGLGAAAIAVVALIAYIAIAAASAPPAPIEQRYASLKFDVKTFDSASAIVCDFDTSTYGDDHYHFVYVQFGPRCQAFGNAPPAQTYDDLKIGQRVTLKMSSTGDWWARPEKTKGW